MMTTDNNQYQVMLDRQKVKTTTTDKAKNALVYYYDVFQLSAS